MFLASDAARYVTRENITADGGFTCMCHIPLTALRADGRFLRSGGD